MARFFRSQKSDDTISSKQFTIDARKLMTRTSSVRVTKRESAGLPATSEGSQTERIQPSFRSIVAPARRGSLNKTGGHVPRPRALPLRKSIYDLFGREGTKDADQPSARPNRRQGSSNYSDASSDYHSAREGNGSIRMPEFDIRDDFHNDYISLLENWGDDDENVPRRAEPASGQTAVRRESLGIDTFYPPEAPESALKSTLWLQIGLETPPTTRDPSPNPQPNRSVSTPHRLSIITPPTSPPTPSPLQRFPLKIQQPPIHHALEPSPSSSSSSSISLRHPQLPLAKEGHPGLWRHAEDNFFPRWAHGMPQEQVVRIVLRDRNERWRIHGEGALGGRKELVWWDLQGREVRPGRRCFSEPE